MIDHLTARHLAALCGFGLLVLGLQVGWILATDFEQSADLSFSLLSPLLADSSTDLSEYAMSLCVGVSCLLLGTVASAALALPLTVELRMLQHLLLSALLLLSVGWQLFGLSEYHNAFIPVLISLGLYVALLLRVRPSASGRYLRFMSLTLTAAFTAGFILIGIRLIGLSSWDPEGLTRSILVLLLGLTLVGQAVGLRERAALQGKSSLLAAFIFQFWLLTVFMPTPPFFANLD